MTKHLSAYAKMIIEATGCEASDAANVENLMRDQYTTLDHLDRRTFRSTAKAAYKAYLWSKTPEGLAYIEQLKKEFYG